MHTYWPMGIPKDTLCIVPGSNTDLARPFRPSLSRDIAILATGDQKTVMIQEITREILSPSNPTHSDRRIFSRFNILTW